MFTKLPIISNSVCKEWYEDWDPRHKYVGYIGLTQLFLTGECQVDDTLMCTGLIEGGRDACKGDSGGALLTQEEDSGRWLEVGIISAGYKCGLPRVPGIYSRVATFSRWVQDQVT